MKHLRRLWSVNSALLWGPILLVALFLVFEKMRGRILLARIERRLAAQGVKLTAADFKPAPVSGTNAAEELRLAISRLRPGQALPDHPPRWGTALASGRTIVGFKEEQWQGLSGTLRWDDVSRDLHRNAEALREIRRILQSPVLRNAVDYSEGFKVKLGHLTTAKAPAAWFAGAAQVALREREPGTAVDNLVAMVHLQKPLLDDRLVMSELVRVALGAVAQSATWQALQFDDWRDEDLLRLQAAWESHDFIKAMLRALEGELVLVHESRARLRTSYAEASDMLYAMQNFMTTGAGFGMGPAATASPSQQLWSDAKKQVHVRLWMFAWLDQSQARSLESIHGLLAAAREAVAANSLAPFTRYASGLEKTQEKKGRYDQLRFPDTSPEISLRGIVSMSFRAETDRSMTVCAVALKRFFMENQRLPSSLSDLVPEFLSSVPIDSMDGRPMRYRLTPDGTFVLYSVGQDGEDDGGDASAVNAVSGNKWSRRDALWPMVATAEDVQQYRTSLPRP